MWLGFDVGLGPFADQPLSRWQEAFVPMRLADALPPLGWHRLPLRLAVLGGLLLFVGVAAACAWFGRGWLTYPSGWAKPLILLIEAAATLSIGLSLALLVVGERAERQR